MRSLTPFLVCGALHAQVAVPAPSSSASALSAASAALNSPMNGTTQSMSVLAGRSLVIKTQKRLKKIYVSNPAVLDTFISTPNQLVATAKTPGFTSLMLWDENGDSQTYSISSLLDLDHLQQAMRQSFPHDNITVSGDEDRLSLTGAVSSEAASTAALKLASLYSSNVTNSLSIAQQHAAQVKLKVQVIEIDRSKAESYGFNFLNGSSSLGATQTGQFGTTTLPPAGSSTQTKLDVSSLLNLFYFNSKLGVGATLEDLESKQILQILAEPTITAVSGQEASFLSGGEFPFPVVEGSASGYASISIQFRPYGVKLIFTPQVSDDGVINLKVAPEVSALDYTNAVEIDGYTIPALSTRKASTQVELRSGQSFAISGLLDHRTTDLFNKMPGIADVPILGQLFKSKSIDHTTVDLVVIVTPTLVDPLTDSQTPTLPKLPVAMLDKGKFDSSTIKPNGEYPKTPSSQPW